MVDVLSDIAIADSVFKKLAPFAGMIAIAGAGFAGAEVYEHKAPWGLLAQRDRDHALAVTNATNWRAMKADRDAWRALQGKTEAQRKAERDAATASLQSAEQVTARSGQGAFDQGYAAGKAAGARNCGGQNATHGQAGDGRAAGAKPGGVHVDVDFSDLWANGAYKPPA